MKKLVIGGLGIHNLAQLTLETVHCLQASDQVLYLGTFPQTQLQSLKDLGAKNISSVFELYKDGDIDTNNYQRLFEAIHQTAEKNELTLLLVPGHPRIGVSIVQWFERRRQELPFDLQILPAVSSFDSMINDLGRDPLEKGSLILDANRMLLFKTQWDTSLDCYIYHVCSVGTQKVHLSDAKKENNWSRLKNHLLSLYGAQKTVKLIGSSVDKDQPLLLQEAQLENLELLLEHVHFGTTLFIEGTLPRSIDKDFYLSLGVKNAQLAQ